MTELTILMPCLNEGESLAFCIREAKSYLASRGICGQVLIVDNGSADGSPQIALKEGADVVTECQTGYGNAIRRGIAAAKGKYILLSDCDGSYDLSNADAFVQALRGGCHLVIGNRFAGTIQPGAMPWSHRYIGVPLLSLLGRLRFGVDVKDFHCGLRGFSREAALVLPLSSCGMEFATELIGRFAQAGLQICQVPCDLRKALRSRPSHLRTLPDGLRHLKLLVFWPGK